MLYPSNPFGRRELLPVVFLAACCVMANGQNLPPASKAENYGRLPLSFEANQGQTDSRVRFLSRGEGYALFLTDSGATLSLAESRSIRMDLPQSIAPSQIEGEIRLAGTANYFIGNKPANWRSNIPTYSRVKYTGVYPGIDLVYYGNQSQLEYDFLVAPGADPGRIRLRLSGADTLHIGKNGDLIVSAGNSEIAFRKPVIYQQIDGERKPVHGDFALLSDNTVGFRLGRFDRREPLVIDPVLVYSTYVGGSGGSIANAIAVDADGDTYIAGAAFSADFPVTDGAYQTADKGKYGTAFVCKMNPTGTALVYCTFLGGSDDQGFSYDQAYGLAIDSEGDAYVAGQTSSSDFPITNGAAQTTNTGKNANQGSSFITKLNPTGSALVYSTFLNGAQISALAVDHSGNAYTTGTCLAALTVTAGAFQTKFPVPSSDEGQIAPFVTKLNAAGSELAYSTYLGGSSGDVAKAITVDDSGNAFIVGTSYSDDYPVTPGAYQTSNRSVLANGAIAGNAYLTKLNPAGSELVYSTYLGGTVQETGSGVAIDSAGDAFITGTTESSDFPVTKGAFQTVYSSASASPPFSDCDYIILFSGDGFVTKLNPAGSALLYSTYLAGSNTWYENGSSPFVNCSTVGDSGTAIAVDGAGNAYITGQAGSDDFPVTALAYQPTNHAPAGSTNLFITKLNPAGTSLVYSTYLGGSTNNGGDAPTAIALDAADNIYLTGFAQSTDFPVTVGAFQTKNPYNSTSINPANGFISKITPPSTTLLTPKVTVAPASASIAVTQTLAVAVTVTGTGPTPTGTVTLTSGTYKSATTKLVSGKVTITVPANSLASGSDTLTVKYSPDTASSTIYLSATGTATETVTAGAAAAPVFTPAAGTYSAAQSVKLTSTTAGATIYYTLNGTTPTTSSTKYTAAISVKATETLKAIAVATGFKTSAVASALYTIDLAAAATPVFTPKAGTYTSAQSVTITDTTKGAVIYYTTNGVTPTTSSTKYTAAITVKATETLKAIAVATGFKTSAVASALYTIDLAAAATPAFTPKAGTYTSAQSVTITDATKGAVIYYTTNGTAPTTSSTKYTAAISVKATETLKAIAVATGFKTSAVASALYTIHLPATATPTFSVAAGTYASAQTVKLADATSGAILYYTTNGATPTTASTKYAAAITVSKSETLKAVALAPNHILSAVATAAYTIK